MYADVVVLTYQPPDIPTYTYEIPKNLEKEIKIGQLVSVPFGKRNPIGVVIETRDQRPEAEITVRPISSIVLNSPILLPYQIELLKWISDYYHGPMVNCLEAMLPEIPKRQLAQYPGVPTYSHPGDVQAGGVRAAQTIVLVPSVNRIAETLAKYPHAKNYIVYHNQMNTSQKFAVWQKILTSNVDYIFGSRSAIFTPCPNLSEIIIFDEHEEGYHDDRSPYYNTLTIAEKIQQLINAKLQIFDSSPKITTYFNHITHLQGVRAHPGGVSVGGVGKVQIVNMLDEKKAGNKSPISQILEEYIKKGHERGKKILLFLNKKVESGHIYCRNCKYSDFAPKQPENCPECQSPDIFFSSLNINSLITLVNKIVPNASIDIATAAVFYSQKSSAYKLQAFKYDLVAHIQADSLLNITDFSSAEKLFAQITNLKRITRGLLLLQTYNPQDSTITAAASGNFQKFFQEQLEQRKNLAYPPFSLLVKLSVKGRKARLASSAKQEENLEEKAQRLYDELSSQFTVSGSKFAVLGPYKSIFSGIVPRYNIILKIPVESYSLHSREKAIKNIEPLLSKIPRDWQIEMETNSLN